MLSRLEAIHMHHRCWRYRFKAEVPSISLVRHAALEGRTLLDVGASRGIYSIYLSRAAGATGRVISFEPQPELGEHLESVKRSFRLDNLTIENVGLSSAHGSLQLRRPKPGSGHATFHGEKELDGVWVPVVRLDDYLDEAGVDSIHFIKCDVEMHEWDVFKGAENTLRRDLPILLFETRHDAARGGELFEYLCDLGYDGFFYHVSRNDHRSLLHKNRGRYVHFSEFDKYDYVRPSLTLRNYVFLRRGTRPETVHYPS